MDLRIRNKNNIQQIIKDFEKKTDRIVYAIYDGNKVWLINSKPKGFANDLDFDPFYIMNKNSHTVKHFDPCSANDKERESYFEALEKEVYKK